MQEFKHLQAQGYGAVYFVADHFLLQPKRIEAICKGINDNDITMLTLLMENRTRGLLAVTELAIFGSNNDGCGLI